jgi:hypothetical protein
MTLWRRAPREVYRLYGEEEFFADAPANERSGATSAVHGPQLQRLVGVTMLLAVIGAVGGVIAVTLVSSVAGGRRRGGVRSAAAARGSALATRPDVWRARRSSGVQSAWKRAMEPAQSSPRAGMRARGLAVAPRRRSARVAVNGRVGLASPAQVSMRPEMPEVPASAPIVQRQPVQVEFGFER